MAHRPTWRSRRRAACSSIRVGDPDRTVSGPQTYVLTYHVEGALNAFDDYDELYWDAIGTEWTVPIRQATVRVDAPAIEKARCFTGALGSAPSAAPNCVSESTSVQAQAARVSVTALASRWWWRCPRARLTSRRRSTSSGGRCSVRSPSTPATVGAAVAALVLAGVGVFWVLRRGRDRRYVGQIPGLAPVAGGDATEEVRPFGDSGEGPVEWSPPDDLRPGLLGTLIDEQANVLDVTATIVDLAVRGYLRIDEIPDKGLFSSRDWQLVQLKGGDPELLDYEQKLFSALFTGRNVVRLSELKRTFADDLSTVQDALYDELVYRKWYRRRPDSTRSTWALLGFVVIAAAIGLTYLLARYTHLRDRRSGAR